MVRKTVHAANSTIRVVRYEEFQFLEVFANNNRIIIIGVG